MYFITATEYKSPWLSIFSEIKGRHLLEFIAFKGQLKYIKKEKEEAAGEIQERKGREEERSMATTKDR